MRGLDKLSHHHPNCDVEFVLLNETLKVEMNTSSKMFSSFFIDSNLPQKIQKTFGTVEIVYETLKNKDNYEV